MSDKLFPVIERVAQSALIGAQEYTDLYQQSVKNPTQFWSQQGQRLDWYKPYKTISNVSFAKGNVNIQWYTDGQLNACFNCVDRHLPEKSQQNAIIWEGDEPDSHQYITYQQLHEEVCKLANVLLSLGVSKGDRVIIYMPMIPQATYAMLACARIGAVHSVIFGGFSPNAIADRIDDCGAKVVLTANVGRRGGNTIPLKANVDAALCKPNTDTVSHVVVYPLTTEQGEWHIDRDVCWQASTVEASAEHQPQVMDAEDPLFILYTSGSTGKPKGLVHTTGGYMVYASLTHELIFDYHPDDIYWCAADVGWITGHSYIVYGPLANGATTVMFEGVPNYPSVGRVGEIIDKHQVNILYTAPTAIRALMAFGSDAAKTSERSSLRVLGSVGEPINPEAWLWYYNTIGNAQCPIVDTWWQTETGGIMITPLPGVTDMKPGSATRPFFGIVPELVDSEGEVLPGATSGNLVISQSWPGQARTVWGDHQRFEETYFSTYRNKYFSGDGARRDEDGDYWITGRVDDVLNVSGHRLGTAEIESALVAHQAVAEAAVVGYPHSVKGQGIYVYLLPTADTQITPELTLELRQWVGQELSPIAKPDLIQWTDGLPKTRSGKIMRRILRKIAADDFASLGDTSTLADPSVVERLIEQRISRVE